MLPVHSVKDEVLMLQVAEALSRTKESAVVAHARDELGIDLEDLANPLQVILPMTIHHP